MRRLLLVLLLFLGACSESDRELAPRRPGPRGGFAFAAIGDFGTGGDDQTAVAERMCEWMGDHRMDIVVTTGDNVYPAGQPESFDDALYEPFECLIDNGVRFHATLGNHDVLTDAGFHQLNEEMLGMKGRRNYVVREAGVRFVMADSNDLDADWLEREIRREPGDRWTVVAFHHPVYSAGTRYGSTEEYVEELAPLFSQYDVDLVLNGHEHLYSATREIEGVNYVVTGGGGAKLYECGELDVVEVCEEQHHFVYVEVDRDRMTVTAVPQEGDPFHTFTIESE